VLSEKDAELWCLVNNAATLVAAEGEWQTQRQIENQVRRQNVINVMIKNET